MVTLTVALVVGAFVLGAEGATLTQTRVPTSTIGTPSGTWTPSTGTTIWGVIDDAPPLGSGTADDDYVTHGTAAGTWVGGYSQFTVPNVAGSVITRVSVYTRAQRTANQAVDVWPLLHVAGATQQHTAEINTSNGTYANTQSDWTTNPVTGVAWTVDEVNGIGATALTGFGLTSTDANPAIRVAQMYIEVEYQTDDVLPIVDTTDPASGQLLGTPSYTIQGTASDAGSGVSSVDVQIERFSGATSAGYWTGTNWTGTSSTWLDATGTTSWSYSWNLDPNQNGEYTYTITSRAYDAANNLGTDATPVTGVTVSNLGPSIVSADVVDATHVDVVFDESVDPDSIVLSDFALDNGATISAFSVAGSTVRLTTSALTPNVTYTVSMPGVINDLAGNPDRNNTATFQLVPALSVSAGSDYPSAMIYRPRGAVEAVDHLLFTASAADSTITGVTVRGRDTASALTSDVSAVRLFVDAGTIGTWEPAIDTTQIGGTATFSGDAGDGSSVASFSGLSHVVPVGTSVRVWVVYTIGASAGYDRVIGSEVQAGDVTVASGTVTVVGSPILSSGSTAGQTIYIDGPPTVAITAPASDGAYLTGSSVTLQGTASDGGGSGVTAVAVSIQRSDGTYWDGTWSSALPVWNAATTVNSWADWTYDWSLDAGQDHTYTYTITARATDGSSSQSTAVRSSVTVDNVRPTILSATPFNATTIDVRFSESLLGTSVQGTDFAITGVPSGLTVLSASLLSADTVRVLTTTNQDPSQPYTITAAAGGLEDLYTNTNALTSADFVGYGLTDTESPTVSIAAPLTNASISTTPFTISGTAEDTGGSGLANVAVRISRSDGQYWTGSGWAAVSDSWHTATGTTNWNYSWDVVSGDRTFTYIVEARATDGATNAAVTSSTGIRVDNVGPAITSASAIDATHVRVSLSEAVEPTTIEAGDFTIAGLSISGATVVGPGNTEVTLTTSSQLPDTSYVVETTAGSFTDTAPFSVHNRVSSASFVAYGSTEDTSAPTPPTTVTAVAGTDPVIATISWSGAADNVGVFRYKVYRATSAVGTYAHIGSVNEPTTTFDDVTGIPGQAYYYKISAVDAAGNESVLSSAAGPVSATWTRTPHAAYSATTNLCSMCHVPHVAASASAILRDAGEGPAETGVCYSCHDGSGASANSKTGPVNSFALASGHRLETVATGGDLTNTCAGCHSAHRDYATTPKLPGGIVNGKVIDDTANAWCLACHDAQNAWYGAGYPNPASPSVDDTGYPTLGTFPTITASSYIAYTDSARNAHYSIPASSTGTPARAQGDCLYCHASHRGPSNYDGLVAAFRPSSAATLADDQANGTYAAVCFKCHGSNDYGLTSVATNIKQFVTVGGSRSGHRIKTAGGTYPVGAPLPCYECHNPHGSTRNNRQLFSDVLGQSLETTTAAGGEHLVRNFCFTCHTAAGDDAATPDNVAYTWDSVGAAYVPVTAGAKTAGLARDAAIGANVLRLPAVSGHYRDDTKSCYTCHGASYMPGGNNVHNPSGGMSAGGEACYSCHSHYQAYMEDGAGLKTGSQRLSAYHHVLGGTSGDGDFAPAVAADLTGYPTGFSNGMYCLTCHVDHDKFNASPGANLRLNATSTTDGAPYATNTDYDIASPFAGGLCTSCHAIAVPRDATDQKAADTQTVVQSVDFNAYDSSAHQYKVTSEFGAGNAFLADCSKCHTDEQAKEFQTSANAFGTHWSAERSILTAFGATAPDPLGETHCYGCHTGGTAGPDAYGTRPDYGAGPQDMTALARSTESQFSLLSKHPVVPTGTGAGNVNSVECANCHNPHEVTAASPVSDPTNTYNSFTYSSVDQKSAFCLKCHSSAASLPAYAVDGSTLVPSTVTIATADQLLMNKFTYSARGHWAAYGSISVAEQIACGSCHDNHGSNAPKLLGVYDIVSGSNKIGVTTVSANNNAVCYACHTAASTSYPAAERDATTGYLNDGTWPGSAVYTQSYIADTSGNGHLQAQGVATLNSLPITYPAGDCKVCHDVHGTSNTYDETRLAFGPTTFTLCFDCHDTNGPAGSNIKTYYPASVGGTGTGTGHQIKTGTGTLPLNSGLPCYDCHNPHGNSNSAYGLTVVTESAPGAKLVIGDAAGEIRMSATDRATAVNVRNFCFACHTTGDTAKGWDGASLQVVTPGAKVEGIDRTIYDEVNGLVLRLPNNVVQHREGGSQSCYQCHGNDYSLSGQNVHNPSGGISGGGQDCYTCHTAYQTHMEDDQGTKRGDSNDLSYHHVLGAADGSYDGDRAFPSGSYPTSTTDVYCLSCHVDHNLFNTPDHDLAANLRPDLAGAPTTGVAYDWSDAANTGVCTSCHGDASLAKSGSAEKLSDGRSQTPTVSNADYDTSAHKYAVSSTFASDTTPAFSASCAKCHNDEQVKDFQTSTYAFGTHWSANQHILSALGGTNGGALQQSHCYRCHAETTDFVANGGTLAGVAKPAAGKDWYNTASMTTAGTEKVYKQFNLTSKHPVNAAGGDSVECESCHNPHEVSATSKVSDPDNTYAVYAYSDVTNQPSFCLKCHDGSLPAQSVSAVTYVPYNVTQANTAINTKSDASKTSKGHWTTSGSIEAGERVSCAQCHDNHGSNAPKLLGVYDPATGTSRISGTAITANNNTVCYACHASATGVSYTREANGYPGYGTWPGSTTYNSGIHNAATVKWPGRTDASGGECWNCHDVHGTMSAYDELVGQFTPTSAGNDRYALCFTCHDADGPSTRNIKQYFPTADGGTATGGNYGHVIKTAGGTLAAGQGMPCYDCHNPHGSAIADGLLVMSQNNGITYAVGDATGEINMSTASGNRQFCFLCHSTADATPAVTDPTDGAGYVGATGTALVEGLSRTAAIGANKLRLPAVSGHYQADAGSCYSCHGSDYTSATSNNVHNPGAGGSNGGAACNTCHSGHATMTNDTTTYHHVLDSATPFRAPGANNTYPTDTSNPADIKLECVSCHTDHNNFNSNKGANLRVSIDSNSGGPGSYTNTDFLSASPYGICVSCHDTALTKNTTGQKTTGASAVTPAISGATYAQATTKHNYVVNDAAKVGYGSSAFQANCTKCHDDDMDTGSKMTSTYVIGVHKSSENRIAKALGAPLAGTSTSTEENLCYACHITATASSTDKKTVANRDAFDVTGMTTKSEAVYAEFQKTYKHPVGDTAAAGRHKSDEGGVANWNPNTARHVECEDCHNPHTSAAGTTPWPTNAAPRASNTVPLIAGANRGVWGVDVDGNGDANWNGGTATFGLPAAPTYSRIESSNYQWQLCLKCHSRYGSANPPLVMTVNNGNLRGPQTDVGADFSPKNYSVHPVFSVGKNNPSNSTISLGAWSSNQWDNSAERRNINGVSTGNALSNTFTDGWLWDSRVVCTDCHNNNDPLGAGGPHGSTNRWLLKGVDPNIKVTEFSAGVTYPNAGAAAAGVGSNFCLNCHRADVYGYTPSNGDMSAATAEELSRFSHNPNSGCMASSQLAAQLRYAGCLICHGARKDTNSYYQTSTTVVQSGAIHGTSMTDPTLFAGGDPMGYRFMNGASWANHTLGDTTGSGSCWNFKGITVDTSYSSCTQHSNKTFSPNYYFARPTN